jgi:hypothetical protein
MRPVLIIEVLDQIQLLPETCADKRKKQARKRPHEENPSTKIQSIVSSNLKHEKEKLLITVIF